MTEERRAPRQRREAREVIARFEKSNLSRVIWADGAWGGITSQGNLHMALYSEHRALPESMALSAGPEGRLNQRTMVDPGGLTREIEVEVILSPAVAQSLIVWLTDRLKDIERIQKEVGERRSDGA